MMDAHILGLITGQKEQNFISSHYYKLHIMTGWTYDQSNYNAWVDPDHEGWADKLNLEHTKLTEL